jgi:hypothetical protein
MQTSDVLPQFAESFAARRVYSEPYRDGDVTVITAAAISGGGGLGKRAEREDGGGLGLAARPVGAYVVRNGTVEWKPAFDLSRIVLRGQIVMLTALLVVGFVLSRRALPGKLT